MKKSAFLSGAVLCVSSAWAVPTMTLMDGNPADTVVITDGDQNDENAVAGEVSYTGRVGSWFMDINMLGQSKPFSGSTLVPSMTLQFAAASKETGGTLRILFSDDFFGPINGNALASLSGTTEGNVTASAYFDQNNVLSSEQNAIGSQMGPFSASSPNGLSASQTASVLLNYPYSLTLEVDITDPDNATQKLSSSGGLSLNLTPVPDGGATLAMLGFGLVGVAGLRRRFGRA